MSALMLNIHSKTPELRKIHKVAEAINDGAVILYPTDTGFSLGCGLAKKEAIERIRSIRRISMNHGLTFLFRSLSNISEFAKVNDDAFRIIKGLVPGPYTFILPASREVPKYAQNPKKKTAGMRVPDNDLAQLLLKDIGSPILSISAKHPEGDDYFDDYYDLIEYFAKHVDIAVTSDEYNFHGESTVINMITNDFYIQREGAGIEKALEYVDFPE